AAKDKIKGRAKRRIRDLRHKGTSQIVQRCVDAKVTDIYVGDPTGARYNNRGRYHNQRMSLWEAGKDLAYLEHKAEKAGISFTSGTERGTSSCCPECGFKKKVKGRVWACPRCPFKEHRDVVGGMNMFPIGFGRRVSKPTRITYLRPGPLRRTESSSSLDTGQSCLAESDTHNQRASARVPLGTGQGVGSPLEALSL
ncbi:MAG: zinc ribbon domain-containing protein, partial [Chlamydiia bacterium]